MPEQVIPNCTSCGTPLQKHPHKDYWVCPKWLPHNQGCPGMIYYPPGVRKNNYPNIAFSYKVESKSQPGKFYQVKVYEDGSIEDGCIADQQGKFCRHKKEMMAGVEKLLTIIKKENNL